MFRVADQLHPALDHIHREYENYAWKVNKDGETVGIEDPKCANHLSHSVWLHNPRGRRLYEAGGAGED
jgi:hypothetical protein